MIAWQRLSEFDDGTCTRDIKGKYFNITTLDHPKSSHIATRKAFRVVKMVGAEASPDSRKN